MELGGVPRQGGAILVRVSGADRPGITAGLLEIIADAGGMVLDMEQVRIRNRLTLGVLVELDEADRALKELLYYGWARGLAVDFEVVEEEPLPLRRRWVATIIGKELPAAALAAAAGAIAAAGTNIDRIVRLSTYPVVSFQLEVSGGDGERLRAGLMGVAADHGIDVALQREGLQRRAKRLVVLDVDSTLVQDEIIDLLADEVGVRAEVEALTAAAMRGDADFGETLRARVRLLAGTAEEVLERVAGRIRLTPGARTFVRTLQRLGYEVAIVSGGFSFFTDRLAAQLGIAHAYANRLETDATGRLTGAVVEPLVDRAAKAALLRRIAAEVGVPLEQVVAVGDGANDLDMLAAAGLGIAFNAKPSVRAAADTALSVPYLDAVLFVLGIRREDVEVADLESGI